MRQEALFGGARLQMTESIELTIDSLRAYGPTHRHWAIAWSGGKDSTALVTLVAYLLDSGKVPRPESLVVLYADTRMELLPLYVSALAIRDELEERGIESRTVMAPLDKRFLVYILGRGVPPPNNNTLRWCTRQIKIDPMAAELRAIRERTGEKLLVLTGVRQGESAIRDGRIAMSCGRNGGECGQGWYQETLPGALCDTLAPLLQTSTADHPRSRFEGSAEGSPIEHATAALPRRQARMLLRTWTRAELDRLGPHDLAPDALGVIELDLPDGRTFDAEILPERLRWRDGESGEEIEKR